MTSVRQEHWNNVYGSKPATEVSWFEGEPALSLAMIAASGIDHADPLIDIGGGASVLVDRLIKQGYSDVTVLDIAAAGLAVARARLGDRTAQVTWLAEDIVTWLPPRSRFKLWHDRAVFHFLVGETERDRYLVALEQGLQRGGFVILAPFALTGPERCSGLPVQRYSGATLQAALGPHYRLIEERSQAHLTPAGVQQNFTWCLFRREDRA